MKSRTPEKDGLSVYELCFLILPSISEDKLPSVVSPIREVISKEGGKEIGAEEPFLHPLAYEMSKTVGSSRYVVSEAYLGWIKFELESSRVGAIKDSMDKINEILRFILVRAPRETTFTFAKARTRALEREKEKEKGGESETVPSPVEEQVLN